MPRHVTDILTPATVTFISDILSTQCVIPHNELVILLLGVLQCRQQKRGLC